MSKKQSVLEKKLSGTMSEFKAFILKGNIIDFLIVGFCMFFMIKAVAMVTAKFHHEEEKKEEPAAPAGPTTEELLAEIRDLLRDKGQDAV